MGLFILIKRVLYRVFKVNMLYINGDVNNRIFIFYFILYNLKSEY